MKKSESEINKKKDTSWESVAGWYDELLAGDDTYQTKVLLPNLLRLVAPKGKKIIDIACGQGFFAKAFADSDAAQVVGVDLSPQLIQIAKKSETEKLRFGVSSANNISLRECVGEAMYTLTGNGSFDVATIVLALQNIKDMSGTFKEAARLLKPDGIFVIVLNHPAFRIPKASAWGFDEAEKIQYRRVDRYGLPFTIEVDMNPGEKEVGKKVHTVSFHRPLQDYFKALASAGFSVDGLEEWISHKKSEEGPRAKAEDQSRKEFPMFLTLIARKNHEKEIE